MIYGVMFKIRRLGDQSRYEDGDILAIKPKGHPWGGQERLKNGFCEMDLTEEQAVTFCKKDYGVNEENVGLPVRARKYKMDYALKMTAKNLSDCLSLEVKSPIIDIGFSSADVKEK